MNSRADIVRNAELMESCLTIIAERTEDISPLVYRRFFAKHPDAEELFGGSIGEDVKNYMIIEIIMQLLNLADDNVDPDITKRWIMDHTVYGVTLPMYSTMLESLVSSLAEVMGSDWSDQHQCAWVNQTDKVMVHVKECYPS